MKLVEMKNKNIRVLIAPEHGGNLCRAEAFSYTIIDYDAEKLSRCIYTGTPILYPTPSSVENGEFTWNNKTYRLFSKGKLRISHGLVYDEVWSYEQLSDKSMKIWLNFKPGSELFTSFPFNHRITLTYSLEESAINIEYCIENYDSQHLPFGFALHPYFTKLSGDEGTFVTIPAKYFMDRKENFTPTGKLIPTNRSDYDLTTPLNIGAKYFDNVFTGFDSGAFAKIIHKTIGMEIKCETSDEFKFVVLYNPKNESFFCLENQTCSTNTHNFYNEGFKELSGLIIIPPYQVHKGFVRYSITMGS